MRDSYWLLTDSPDLSGLVISVYGQERMYTVDAYPLALALIDSDPAEWDEIAPPLCL